MCVHECAPADPPPGPGHIIPITHYQSTFLKELVKSRDCGAHLGHHQIESADLTEEAY